MAKKKEKGINLKLDFSKLLLGSIILIGLFMLYGIIVYLNPLLSLTGTRVTLGVFMIIFGLYAIYEFFVKEKNSFYNFHIIWGILAILAGLLVATNIFNINKIFTFSLGIYLVIIALDHLINALKLRKLRYDGWALMLGIGIVELIFGAFNILGPILDLTKMDDVKLASIFVILICILELSNYIVLYTQSSDVLKLLNGKKAKAK